MIAAHGRHHLFFAGNRWETGEYGIGYASCLSVRGPCSKPLDRPLVASRGDVLGPGSPDVFRDSGGAVWMAYHAWTAPRVGYPQGGARRLHIDRMGFVDGHPLLSGPTQGPVSLVRARRVAGHDRFATAAAFSRASFPAGVPEVWVATGTDFPDALAAAPAAHRGGGPVLLDSRDGVPLPTAEELARLRPAVIKVLGGPEAVPEPVISALREETGVDVVQIAGADRFATAAQSARTAFPKQVQTVLIASGERAPDALAAGAAGAALDAPVLLASADALPAVTAAELLRLDPDRVLIVGGEAALSAGVTGGILGLGFPVQRVAGEGRVDTAIALAQTVWTEPVDEVLATTGAQFPDALAAGTLGRPVLLLPTDGTTSLVRDEVRRLARDRVSVLGGPAAVSERTFAELDLR